MDKVRSTLLVQLYILLISFFGTLILAALIVSVHDVNISSPWILFLDSNPSKSNFSPAGRDYSYPSRIIYNPYSGREFCTMGAPEWRHVTIIGYLSTAVSRYALRCRFSNLNSETSYLPHTSPPLLWKGFCLYYCRRAKQECIDFQFIQLWNNIRLCDGSR